MSYVKSEHNRSRVNRFHLELFDQGNLNVADEILADDFVAHAPGTPAMWLEGVEGVKRAVIALRDGCTNIRVLDREDTVTKGGKVAVRWILTATHSGELFGIPPTGHRFTVTGISIFRMDPNGLGGKIAEMWIEWDQVGLMQQLGAILDQGAILTQEAG